jgi:glycerol kinase
MLPEVRSSSEIYGETSEEILGVRVPISGIAGDQQAATFGQACFSPGAAKNTYGTGCFMLLNTGEKPVESKNNLLTTIGWSINGRTTYCLEGSVFIAGAVVQWLRDGLGIIKNSADVEQLAATVDDSGGVYFVPAFVGLGAPYWDPYARGTIVGLTRGTTAGHIARAAVESMAFQTRDLAEAMRKDSALEVQDLKVDGGASVNNALMQLQADVLGSRVHRPVVAETTALGAAYLAGLAVGYWRDLDDVTRNWALDREFSPELPAKERDERYAEWLRAVERSRDWAAH